MAQVDLKAVLQKYDSPAPRYTSYPTALAFHQDISATQFAESLTQSVASGPINLYIHLPFCAQQCYFCGCSMVVTHRPAVIDHYLEALERDLKKTTSLLEDPLPIATLHLGGGTPNYLSEDQLSFLIGLLSEYTEFSEDAAWSIEANPALLTPSYVERITSLGFGRISLGIQDFNEKVLRAVNRYHPEEQLLATIATVNSAGLTVNFDLMYGLPHQTEKTFLETLKTTIACAPDRIALFQFAYLPALKQVQSLIPAESLPSSSLRLALFLLALSFLQEHGYHFIGMDHFAREGDPLLSARKEGRLHRSFQGYEVTASPHTLGLGATAISFLDGSYYQRHKKVRTYQEQSLANELPLERGYHQTAEDSLRHEVIKELMCHARCKPHLFGDRKEEVQQILAEAMPALREFSDDGLLRMTPDGIEVSEQGMVIVRPIAQKFDAFRGTVGKKNLAASV